MAHEAVDGPGTLGRRYDALAGDRDRRLTLFLVRKHLGFSAAEWMGLPWWQQRLYADLLNEYLAAESGEEPTEATDDPMGLLSLGLHIEHADTPQDAPPVPLPS